jgi:hypothetical protein
MTRISWERPANPVHPSCLPLIYPRIPILSYPHTSGRNMLPAMPQELSDMIIDFLHNDVAALCTAGLVCKSLLPASRFHLFSRIMLYSMENVPRILELICAEGSTIPPYILNLSIMMPKDESQSVDEMLLRLPLLSNLKTLSLSCINMASLTADAKKRLNIMLQELTSLKLFNFYRTQRFLLYSRSILSHL